MIFIENLDWEEISFRIKTLRKDKKITIERLSEMIETSPSFIGLVERGDSKISIDNLYRLSRILGVSVDYILTGEEAGSVKAVPEQFSRLNASLADYSEKEIDFIIDLIKFLKKRVDLK